MCIELYARVAVFCNKLRIFFAIHDPFVPTSTKKTAYQAGVHEGLFVILNHNACHVQRNIIEQKRVCKMVVHHVKLA